VLWKEIKGKNGTVSDMYFLRWTKPTEKTKNQTKKKDEFQMQIRTN